MGWHVNCDALRRGLPGATGRQKGFRPIDNRNERVLAMKLEGLLVKERIDEATRICAREHPIYEQISGFTLALYVLGVYTAPDLMSCDDVDDSEAAAILREAFVEIPQAQLPARYSITDADDKYLLVFGDPAYPVHFAVLAGDRSPKPYFSKLPFFGSGFDTLEELKSEFLGKDGVGDEIHFFRRKAATAQNTVYLNRIYTVKDDGTYSICEDEPAVNYKEVNACR